MTNNKLIKWLKVIAIIAIIWNLFGVISYLMHAYMSNETLATLPKNQQEFMTNLPSWRMASFAIATFGGLLGSIFLLLKKKIAIPLFILSLIAIIIGNYYDIFMVNYYKDADVNGLILPFLILIFGILFAWYSKKLNTLNILT